MKRNIKMHLIRVFNICKSTRLGVSRIQSVIHPSAISKKIYEILKTNLELIFSKQMNIGMINILFGKPSRGKHMTTGIVQF